MADCIQRSAREVLRVSREGSGRMKGAWWWRPEREGESETGEVQGFNGK